MESQKQQIEKRIKQMPPSCRKNYLRAMKGRSLKSAVKAFCVECVGWAREEVKLCTDLGCPLYPYRPTSWDYKAYSQPQIKPLESKKSDQSGLLLS